MKNTKMSTTHAIFHTDYENLTIVFLMLARTASEQINVICISVQREQSVGEGFQSISQSPSRQEVWVFPAIQWR